MAASLARLGRFARPLATRAVGTTSAHLDNESWLSKLLVRKIEPTKESHSRMLSDKEVIYELLTHDVKPQHNEEYLVNYQNSVKLVHDRKLQCELVASWKVSVGDQDQCLHLWKYTGGFASIDNARKVLTVDKEYTTLEKTRGKMLRARNLQFLLAFSYWPQIIPRAGGNLYEIRSYTLKPGTMIEWGNNWARAINYRRNNDEAYAAFFSQVGRLYNVHHIWCYPDLQVRKETREAAWRMPGWDECVAYTVPLIREMDSRILHPTSFSPTQ
ncbi:protein NipSnap [Neocloeon triangulifer]|uniref:protein NipSnap n=1 Tax=Neocloeon triangulifer TaxID=2078957 RepID=UPI00286F182E|nr:protein NipSnap [Neocloeon triangulifer]XP_059486791.1 protein NipSnap [Neocloeon triangulifer]